MTSFTTHFSFVSAFLVAAYVMAQRLSTGMLSILIGLYTIITLTLVLNMFTTQIDMALLAKSALEADSSGLIELPATTMVTSDSPQVYATMSYVNIAASVAIYIASLVFMFGMRRSAQNRTHSLSEGTEAASE